MAGSTGGTISVRAINTCGNSTARNKTVTVVPFQSTPGNQLIGNGQSQCFNALQNIVIAGFGNTFTIQGGGSATMIAGSVINYLPGTTVENGGYMHGYIAPSGPWCNSGSTIPLAEVNREEAEGRSQELMETGKYSGNASFRIYPNPTTGMFTLELTGMALDQRVEIEIYSLHGERILTESYSGDTKHEFSLFTHPAGIYVVRIVTEGMVETGKVVKL